MSRSYLTLTVNPLVPVANLETAEFPLHVTRLRLPAATKTLFPTFTLKRQDFELVSNFNDIISINDAGLWRRSHANIAADD
jgi:hypothetical protein